MAWGIVIVKFMAPPSLWHHKCGEILLSEKTKCIIIIPMMLSTNILKFMIPALGIQASQYSKNVLLLQKSSYLFPYIYLKKLNDGYDVPEILY